MADFEPSKLGTKNYWDQFYDREKLNFLENDDDTGECWFADSGAEEKMVDLLVSCDEEGEIDGRSASVIDLGTGNGRLLFSLRDAGYEGEFLGVDYSEPSVEFARMVAEKEGLSEGINFLPADILTDNSWNVDGLKWDIVLDKGTFDAISLSDSKYDGFSSTERYVEMVKDMVKPEGIFLITSCNFAESELIGHIARGGAFEVWRTAEYPSFEFGGRKGQTVCTIAFRLTKKE
ncbi:protein-lysine N-methyltransferase Efm4p [Trichomonascus vanleenenianus]|uniref:Efm4p n=1 Tax=Trichomonascus vanleenenianus TaxID=2268995 RepID=UPI003EC95E41